MAKGNGGPRLGCGAKFIKTILIIFNFIFFALGGVILAIGVYVLVDPSIKLLKNISNNNLLQQAEQNGINLTYIDKCGIAFCVFGGVMLFISFMGCCGAMRQVKCLLGLYSTILLLILLAEIAIGIFAAVYSSKLKDILTPILKQSIKDQYMGDMKNKTIASVAWDAVMYNFECCGVNSYSDFNQDNNVWTIRNETKIPASCCRFSNRTTNWSGVLPNLTSIADNSSCIYDPNNQNSNYDIGCYDKIKNIINNYSVIVIAIAIGIGLVLLLGVIFGFYLCKRVRDMDDYA